MRCTLRSTRHDLGIFKEYMDFYVRYMAKMTRNTHRFSNGKTVLYYIIFHVTKGDYDKQIWDFIAEIIKIL